MSLDIEQALVYKLKNTAAVSALVSTRVHPLKLPDTTNLPAVVYTQVSAPISATHDQTSANALTNARYQIDAWSTTYQGAKDLGKAIFAALEGFSGIITSGADSFTVQSCLRADKRTLDDAETGLYCISQDFMFWYLDESSFPTALVTYLTTGVIASEVTLAYQPKGAASQAASYINLFNPGTNNAAIGVEPTWDAVNGWTFESINSEYLATDNLRVTEGTTIIIRYSNLVLPAPGQTGSLFGGRANYDPPNTSDIRMEYGAVEVITPWMNLSNAGASILHDMPASGIVAITKDAWYANSFELETMSTPAPPDPFDNIMSIAIGATFDNDSVVSQYFADCSVQAFVIYKKTLSAEQLFSIMAKISLI